MRWWEKRWLVAVVGLESDAVVPLPFYGFRRRRRAEAKVADLNLQRSYERDHLTTYAVYDRRARRLT